MNRLGWRTGVSLLVACVLAAVSLKLAASDTSGSATATASAKLR
jgi:hypothetical protein